LREVRFPQWGVLSGSLVVKAVPMNILQVVEFVGGVCQAVWSGPISGLLVLLLLIGELE
jgi:hypothetical protein